MISTKVHGVIDYIVGIALIIAPYLFNFSDLGGAVKTIPITLGIVLIVYSLLTDYEVSLVKAISMKTHLVLDFILAAFLAVSPWLFNFNELSTSMWMPHLIVGIIVMLLVFFSESEPSMNLTHQHSH